MGTKIKFPRKITLKNRKIVEIMPLKIEEIPELKKLIMSLDENERALLQDDIDRKYFEKKVQRDIEDDFAYRLVAWDGNKLIGSMVMYRGRAQWLRHTARIRVVIHPKYRRWGIALHLLECALPFAESVNIEKLYLNVMPEAKAAIRLAKAIGFEREATLKDHVLDKYGTYHDMRMYSMDLQKAHKAMEDMLSGMMGYSG